MKYQRVLITGCGGMLGNAIYPYFRERCSDVLATDIQIEDDEKDWLSYLDVRDHDAIRRTIKDFNPELILHLAALVDVEGCEADPAEANLVNTLATRSVATLSAEHGSTLVYISTGGVFDGTKDGNYTEEDTPNPIMVYGATKHLGEHEVRDAGGKAYVLRPGWMVGGGRRNDHKFVSYILDQIRQGASEIYAVTDKVGTPTYTHDFAMTLFALLDTEKFNTYHMVCKGRGTRFDVAKEVVRICGREGEIDVKPTDSSRFQERFWVPRPNNEMLENSRLEALGINLMRDWRVAISDYLHRDYADLIRVGASATAHPAAS